MTARPSHGDDSDGGRQDMAGAIRGLPHPPRDVPRIDRLRKVVKDHQAARMEGLLVDAFTASMLVQVHDALTPENREKFLALSLRRMVDVGWKCTK